MKTGEELRVKNEKYASEKGITLITLIITIIIMLILVGVAVDIAVDGKLVDSAKNAVTKTNEKVEQHQNRIDGLMGELDKVLQGTGGTGGEEENWETIFEGNATTTNGQVLLGEDVLFSPFYEYKITFTSEECSGIVTTLPIYTGSGGGADMYLLFGVGKEQAEDEAAIYTFDTLVEAFQNAELLYSSVGVLGCNQTGVGGGIMLETLGNNEEDPCEYTITKIQKSKNEIQIAGTEIWEGNVTLSSGIGLIELEDTLDLNRKYRICFRCIWLC